MGMSGTWSSTSKMGLSSGVAFPLQPNKKSKTRNNFNV
ncbi:hypothetical protein DVG78_17025 [Runella aurantiaca]|uniref:Uncharacterized protein n=1 Tax=Runella aurantiaca TaxID=2282308 RepID=A0A369IBT5_9BACT|nr:hypothetical protein DVG78_17025 [Runella aurantiaca]